MKNTKKRFALGIDDPAYQSSLITRQIYEILPDHDAARDDLMCINDKSSEDYLYHFSHFMLIELPVEVERIVTSV